MNGSIYNLLLCDLRIDANTLLADPFWGTTEKDYARIA